MTWAEVDREIYWKPKGARRAGWPDGMRVRCCRFREANSDPSSSQFRVWDMSSSLDFAAPEETWLQCYSMGLGNSAIKNLYCQYSISDDWEWIV